MKNRNNVLIYTDNKTDITKYPNIQKYLLENKNILSSRNEVKKEIHSWFRFERPRNKEIFDAHEKIIVPYMATENRFAYDNEQYFNDGGDIRAIVIKEEFKKEYNLKFILGCLNSNLINWYYGFIGKPKGDSREYFNEPLAKIPIPNATEKEQEQVAKLVDERMVVAKKISDSSESMKEHYEKIADSLDKRIDVLVCELYGVGEDDLIKKIK